MRPQPGAARLFCQTLLPKVYTVVLHASGRAIVTDPAGQLKGDVEGNPYHLKFGKNVLQLDPGQDGTNTIFLNVLTAVDRDEAPPVVAYRLLKPGRIEVTVAGAATQLEVPVWFAE